MHRDRLVSFAMPALQHPLHHDQKRDDRPSAIGITSKISYDGIWKGKSGMATQSDVRAYERLWTAEKERLCILTTENFKVYISPRDLKNDVSKYRERTII